MDRAAVPAVGSRWTVADPAGASADWVVVADEGRVAPAAIADAIGETEAPGSPLRSPGSGSLAADQLGCL